MARGKHFVHGPLALALGEANQKSERLGAAERFTGGPLSEGGAENLRAGAFGEDLNLETIEDCVAGICQAEIAGAQLRHNGAQVLRTHAGAVDLGPNSAGESGTYGFQE